MTFDCINRRSPKDVCRWPEAGWLCLVLLLSGVCWPLAVQADSSIEAAFKQRERDNRWLRELQQPEYVIPGLQKGQSRLLEPGQTASSEAQAQETAADVEEREYLLEPPELLPEQRPSLRSWLLGVGVVDQHAENFDSRRLLSIQARLPLTEHWYLIGGMEYGVLSADPVRRDDGVAVIEADSTTLMLHSGLGVPLLRGIVRTPFGEYAPWQVGIEGLLGEQYTGDLSGRYVGAGLNMSLLLSSFWLATDWRWFNVDDDALKAAGIHQGTQLGLSAGVWF